MIFKQGDLVTRKSYNNDVIFRIKEIIDDNAILIGLNVRLYADANVDDLQAYETNEDEQTEDDDSFIPKMREYFELDRSEYFYLPGRILHIDGDENYLKRCLGFYKRGSVNAYGLHIKEEEIHNKLQGLLNDLKPDILVITGHDAYYRKKGQQEDLNSYKNTNNFLRAIQVARNYEKAHDKLIVIAGACQSNYEALIKAGANFASSPKRLNIHALDPAIIALTVSLSDKSKDIDLLGILEKTKYGAAGIGGIITKGTMYVGYPR
ncbi:MAG: sporulation peptidase YabG [Bacilli bacterium]|nr:sporulation peptidase YabG [Bacilli bacterium]MDD4298025.1 sporulation peptidase YabG [Bacilli bacterium]